MKNKIIIALIVSFLVSAATIVAYRFGMFDRIEEMAYDAKMKLFRTTATPPRNIKVILVDDASINAMEKMAGRWPWPRAIWYDLLDFLSQGGAKVVLFDIIFTERQDERNDGALTDATRTAGNVVHSMIVKHEGEDIGLQNNLQLGRPLPAEFLQRFALRNLQGNMRIPAAERSNDFSLPIEGLREAAKSIAVVEFTPDDDGVLRRTRPLREYQGSYFPVLGLAPFIDQSSQISIRKNGIQINDRFLPTDATGNFLINMYDIDRVEPISAGGIFASLQKMREGDVENLIVRPDEFKDSIVFIGVSAVGGADLKATPLARRTPGVVVHVSLAANYLANDFLRPPDRRLTISAVLIGVFLTAGFVFFSKRFLIRATFPFLMLLSYGAYSFYAFKFNMLVDTVPFVFATVTSGFLSFGYLTFTEAIEKRRVSQLFTQYVSKDVLNEVLHNYKEYQKASQGTKVELTVLFSDIRGFTTISETTPPEKIVEMLNIHFSVMADIILKHNGTIDKYIGDAIMAFWGAPVRMKDHAEQAVLAGQEMLAALAEVNAKLREKGLDMEVKIGIGINTGVATIGEIGSEKKKNYTIVGDTVNLASRLESLTKEHKTALLLSEYTHEIIKDRIACRKLGNVKVKGREQAVDIYTPGDAAKSS
ncbi:MAG: adenylate/guanylate cyclase domain-containing protein [Nitrospiraceae bacterium]|nr:adenylate/guanylate cyclase domain-containing protein [Nitrospiraceae bacterium]